MSIYWHKKQKTNKTDQNSARNKTRMEETKRMKKKTELICACCGYVDIVKSNSNSS